MRTAIGLLAAGAVAFGFQGQASGTIAGQVVNQATSTPLQDAIVTLRYLNPSGSDETMVRETNDAAGSRSLVSGAAIGNSPPSAEVSPPRGIAVPATLRTADFRWRGTSRSPILFSSW